MVWWRIGLPLAAGALALPAFAPLHWFFCAPLSLALLFYFWQAPTANPKSRLRDGFLYGLGYFGGGVSWLYDTLHVNAMTPAPVALGCTLLLIGYLALFPLLAAGLVNRAAARCRAWLAMPAAWVLAELLRGVLFSGFPWLTLGVSQAPASPLAGWAPVVGAYGLSLLLAWSAVALLQLRRHWLPALLVLVMLWGGGWGLSRIAWTTPVGAPVSVALVQGNVAQLAKWDPDKLQQVLALHTALAQRASARLIVMPETSFPTFPEGVPPELFESLRAHAERHRSDILVGIAMHTDDGAQYYNSVINVGVSGFQQYSKNHLVPFGEFIPLKGVMAWLYDYMRMPMVDFRPGGSEQAALAVAGQQLALSICYEDVFGGELRASAARSSLMANVSNDTWFGSSIAVAQHLQIAQMRALETGRWWLRATNSGVTAIIDQHGRVVRQFPENVVGVLQGQAQGLSGITPYVRYGDLPLWALVVAGLITSWLLAWHQRRRSVR